MSNQNTNENQAGSKKPVIRKERPITDTLLYKQSEEFMREVVGYVENMHKRNMPLYGTPMIEALREARVNFRLSYLKNQQDTAEKSALMFEAVRQYAIIDELVQEWFAVGIINSKKHARLSVMIGAMLDGANKLYESYRNRQTKIGF